MTGSPNESELEPNTVRNLEYLQIKGLSAYRLIYLLSSYETVLSFLGAYRVSPALLQPRRRKRKRYSL